MGTRVFTRDELDDIGVPFECGEDEGTAEELLDELYDNRRWSRIYRFIFRAPDDGKAYEVYYELPATEQQEGGVDLWDWENNVQAVEVEKVQVVTTEWKPVKESK